MPLVTSSITNMFSGVSQQPIVTRLANMADSIENAHLSVVSGANKRPPSSHVFTTDIDPSTTTSVFNYLIDRDKTDSHQIILDGKSLKVIDLNTKLPVAVNFPEGFTYLTQSNDPSSDFRAKTINDTTWILNRAVTPEEDRYGEIGDYAFTYTTVAAYANLPSSPTLNQYVYVTNEGIFYQYRNIAAQPELRAWRYDGNVQQTPVPSGYTQVASLPATVTVGAKLAIFYKTGFNLNAWRKYTGIISQAAIPAYNGWQALEGKDLPRTVIGRLNPNTMGSVYVVNSIANVNYNIYLNNALVATYLTPKGVDAGSSVPGTSDIAESLKAAATSLPSGVTVTRYGSTLSFKGLGSNDTLEVNSSNGDKAMVAWRQSVSKFDDLSPNEAQGRIVEVKGDVKNNSDSYYVIFDKIDGWVETYGWNEGAKPIGTTMPHILQKEPDGTYTFKTFDWQARLAGDANSNQSPSFIDYKINDLLFYANRLAFVSDTNIIMSEANNYKNFYRFSLATLKDNERIDEAVLKGDTDTLYHATPYANDLLMMSDRGQYRLVYQNILGPKNLTIKFTTSYTMSPDVHPEPMGSSVYYIDDREDYVYAKLYEFYPQENLVGDTAQEASGPVPEYIKKGVKCLAGSTRLNLVALTSDGEPDTIYMYKFFWNGQQKLQNAWNKWRMPGVSRILWIGVSFNFLYAMVQRNNVICVERFYIDELVSRDSAVNRYLIDRQITQSDITISWNATTQKSTITLPFAYYEDTLEVISDGPDYKDARHAVTKVNNTTLVIDDYDLTQASLIRVGIPYTFKYTFSKPFLRKPTRTGETVVLASERLQMKYLTLQTVDTPFFTSRVTYPGRPDLVQKWEGIRMDDPNNLVAGPLGADRRVRIPIMGNNRDLTFTLENNSPWNSQFAAAEWTFVAMSHSGKQI